MAADLAEPEPVSHPQIDRWLEANHRSLVAVSDTLVDNRDDLLTVTPHEHRDSLAEAIDHAGQHITGRASRALASAVAYALFLLRADGPIHLPADSEISHLLFSYQRLRAEYNELRGR